VKSLKVTTTDGQVHVFEGSADEVDTVRRCLTDLGRPGCAPWVRLVNRQGRHVIVYAGSVRSVK
jgi:alkylated DNA nucleotide flippase Atl1